MGRLAGARRKARRWWHGLRPEGGLFQRRSMPRAALSSGQPRQASQFGRATRPYRACFRHRHDGLRACAWPLLKAMLGSPRDGEEVTGFFSFTHEEDGLTLIMDDRSYAAFEESALIERLTCAPDRWRAFEIHLGSLAWEVPGLVCFLSTIMAESRISILNLSTCDRDFVLVPPPAPPGPARPRQPRLLL